MSTLPDPGETRRVVLRDERSETDSRHLSAHYDSDGHLLIVGQDLGDGVERYFGCYEYEWVWTIGSFNLPKLAAALGVTSNLLEALAARFSGDNAIHLDAFLKENEIPFGNWSRIGD